MLVGDGLTGKTTWARMLGNHLYMKERYNARQASLADGVDYGVIDDISGGIRFFPHWKAWFGGQPHVQVRLLYKDESLIKWGKPLIWINNRDPRDQMRDMISRDYSEEQCNNDVRWMEQNAIFVDIGAESIISHANTE